MIYLIFGQPGAGKTTLSEIMVRLYNCPAWFVRNISGDLVWIDGDVWRDVSNNKDYSREGRVNNLKSAFTAAKFLNYVGKDVLLSFVAPYDELRRYLQPNLKMVYLKYSGDRGKNSRFVADFEEPTGDFLSIDTSSKKLGESVEIIRNYFGF